MKNCLLFSLLLIPCFFFSDSADAQASMHTPLKGIIVRLESYTEKGKENDTSCSKSVPIEFETTTNDDGEFMFGYVPPGTYALGCSYNSCSLAFRVSKQHLNIDTTLAVEPQIQISVNACEGMQCHIATKKITPDEWSSSSQPSTMTTITKEWTDAMEWMKDGGGVTLRIDGANSVISGKIQVE